MDKTALKTEVILVVEKSNDDTLSKTRQAINNDPRFMLVANKSQKGKGYAVRTGMLRARGNIIFFMDADLSTSLSCVTSFLAYFGAHPDADILIGSREHPKTRVITPQNSIRRNMGRTFNMLVRHLIIQGVKDTQCGFKAFKKPVAKHLFKLQKVDGFAFDVEILYLAQKFNYTTVVMPVKWSDSLGSKVNIVGGSLKMFMELLALRHRVKKNS